MKNFNLSISRNYGLSIGFLSLTSYPCTSIAFFGKELMMKLNMMKLNIEQRLKAMLGYLHFLSIVTPVFALVSFWLMGTNMGSFYDVQHETIKQQMEIRKDIQTISKRVLWAVINVDDLGVIQEQQADFDERFAKIQGYIDNITLNLNDSAKSKSLQEAWRDVEKHTEYMINLVLQGEQEEAVHYYDTTFFAVTETLANALDEVGKQADLEAGNKLNYSKALLFLSTGFLIVFVTASLIFALYLNKKVIQSIIVPLNEIKAAAKNIAAGKLLVEIHSPSNDEIGEVATSLKESIDKFAGYIKSIDQVMDTMAGGSFNISNSMHFEGDFERIGHSLHYFTDNISSNISEIGNTVSEVTEGSEQIAETVQLLSHGSSQQADIVDMLSKTVKSVTERIEINARDAADISKEVNKVRENILEEDAKMQEVLQAMEQISETSREIEKIIVTINDIASQTNLLALNASIEAARAGEAGRGFAVVADQVSILASQSSEAVKSTTDYIQTALRAVEQGRVTADEAAQKLHDVVANANAITGKVENIASMSNEQAGAVKQINQDIEGITRVLDQNAAASKECSAASEKLAEQTRVLKELILQFELKQ